MPSLDKIIDEVYNKNIGGVKVKETWVQDVREEEAAELISKMTMRNIGHSPKNSKYVTGPSKSGESGKIGIYFQDPTARE